MSKSNGTVLIVEDHHDLAANLGDFLEDGGFTVDFASDGISALHLAIENIYDVIVLDVMMPGIDGYEVCRRLREEASSGVPIIMLTARDTLEDKLKGFESGADDYLIKPFEMRELEARIKSMIKRMRGEMETGEMSIGGLTFDTKTMHVTREGKQLKLSPIGLHILRILMRESPKLISREKIEAEIWGEDLPDSDALRSHLYNLRKVVDKPFETELLHTIQGLGYKFCTPEEA